MKKHMIIIATMLIGMSRVAADEVTVAGVTIPQGGQATININFSNPDNTYTAGQMLLVLPMGVTAVLNSNGDPTITKGERLAATNHSIGTSHLEDGTDQFTIFSISSEALQGTEGILFDVIITAEKELVVGTELDGQLTNIEMTTTDAIRKPFNNQTFTITIGEPADSHIILDENSTTAPEAAVDADVLLKRIIKANDWSTICLPFAATGEQVKTAFGEDVQLAEFTAWESEEDNDGAIVGINVTFTSANAADGIPANTPMLIRVSKAVTEVTFDDVTLEPEEEPVVQVGRKASERGRFYGTYTVMQVPEENLFLSAGKFWYSTGVTTIKGYRGYFEFRDVLDAYYDGTEVKINIFIDDEETGIDEIVNCKSSNSNYFDLSGRKVAKPQQHGVYIINGKKMLK